MKIIGIAILVWFGIIFLMKVLNNWIIVLNDEDWTPILWATVITIGVILILV